METFSTLLPALGPALVTALGAVLALGSIAVRRHHGVTAGISLVALLVSACLVPFTWSANAVDVTQLLTVDRLGLAAQMLVFLCAAGVCLMASEYLDGVDEPEEFYPLLLLSSSGAAILAVSSHFASLFLGLELLTVPLLGMLAYVRRGPRDKRAALQYFVMAAATSAALLFGMALVFAATGAFTFAAILDAPPTTLTFVGGAFMLVAVGFKLGLVPFHMWVPDVYAGAPSPVTAFVATASKAGVLVVLARLAVESALSPQTPVFVALAVIASLSMFLGNLLALRQRDPKRILAFSSVAHFGYLLLPILAVDLDATFVYLAAYAATTVGAFAVVSAMSSATDDTHDLDDYRGLFWRRPLLAGLFALHLFSLAGIPLTAGFVGKLYVVYAAVGDGMWLLTAIFVGTSVIGLYYYLRIVYTMFDEAVAPAPTTSTAATVVAAAAAVVVLIVGFWPASLVGLLG